MRKGDMRSFALGKLRSKSERKRQYGRYLLDAMTAYTKAKKRREGSSGAASPVRHVYNRDRDEPR
jgi:hypothetical protein